MSRQSEFKRVVIGFGVDLPPPLAFEFAARLAQLLNLDLLGLFLMDELLDAAAAYPGAREFLAGQAGWRTLEANQLQHELELVTKEAERTLAARAASRQLASGFRVLSGSPEVLKSVPLTTDILIVSESSGVAAALTGTSTTLIEAAIKSAASVLFIPQKAEIRTGPVIALASAPGDPSIAVASSIASISRAQFMIVEMFEPRPDRSGEASSGQQAVPRRVSVGSALESDPGLLFGLIGPPSESLIVYTRRENDFEITLPRALARLRKTPVLILEPAGTVRSQPQSESGGVVN